MGTHLILGMASLGSAAASTATPTPAHSAKARQLDRAAQEFEGMLISELWKGFQNDPLTSSGDSGDADTDDSGGSMQSLGVQAMATALSADGGLGLATMIEHQLAPDLAPAAAVSNALKPLKAPPLAADIPIESGTSARPPAGATSAASTGGRS